MTKVTAETRRPSGTPVAEQTSLKAINSNISKIRGAGSKLNDAIHTTGLMILAHSQAYNDCTGAARLVDAMPKTHRRALVIKWFEMFSPIVIDKKGDQMNAHLAKDGSPKNKKYNIEGAKANPFHNLPEVQNEPGLFTFEDLQDAINRLVARAERMLKDNRVAAGDIDTVKARIVPLKAVAALTATTTPRNDAEAPKTEANEPARKAA